VDEHRKRYLLSETGRLSHYLDVGITLTTVVPKQYDFGQYTLEQGWESETLVSDRKEGGFQGYILAAPGNLNFIGIFAFAPEGWRRVNFLQAMDYQIELVPFVWTDFAFT
jgi:hypothetical protein